LFASTLLGVGAIYALGGDRKIFAEATAFF